MREVKQVLPLFNNKHVHERQATTHRPLLLEELVLDPIRTPLTHDQILAAIPATTGDEGAEASNLRTGAFTFDLALFDESAVNNQSFDTGLTPGQGRPHTSRADELTVNSRGIKQGRVDDLDQPRVSSKRARGGEVLHPLEATATRPQAHASLNTQASGGAAERVRDDDDSDSTVVQKRPRRENSSTRLGSLSTSQASLPAPAVSLDDVPSRDDNAVTVSYRQVLEQLDRFKRNGNLWQAAGAQAAVNVSGNDRLRAVQLFHNPNEEVFLERSRLLARQSGMTHKQMVDKLETIQSQHASTKGVSNEDRTTALRIQAAFNVSSNREYGAPALYFVQHPSLQREADRIARETPQGPCGAHWSLTAQQRLTILFHASDVRSEVVRQWILSRLRPYGLDLDDFSEKGKESLLPNHEARVIEYMVARSHNRSRDNWLA